MSAKPMITIVNDEPTFRWSISRALEAQGYAVHARERNLSAPSYIREMRPIAVILEAEPGSAVAVTSIVEQLRNDRATRFVPIIACSPDGRFLSSYGEYLRDRGCAVLGRPFNVEQLVETIARLTSARVPEPEPIFCDSTPLHSRVDVA